MRDCAGFQRYAMAKPREIEVSVKFAIEAMQHIQVELGRDPVSVVVGSHQGRLIFHHVDSLEQRITRLQLPLKWPNNCSRLFAFEVADT